MTTHRDKRFRAAVAGCGMIGAGNYPSGAVRPEDSHVAALHSLPEIQLVAVCDTNSELAQLTADRYKGCRPYSSFKEMLKEQEPEIVSICTPNPTHFEFAQLALNSNCVRSLVIEKPIAMTSSEAHQLVELCSKSRIPVSINYTRRFVKEFQNIKSMILSGQIGSIQTVTGYYTKGLLHNGSHWIDLGRFLFGDVLGAKRLPEKRSNTLSEPISQALDRNETSPELDVWISFERAKSCYLFNLSHSDFSLFEMDVVGTRGRIRILDSGRQIETFSVTDSPTHPGYRTLHPSDTLFPKLDRAIYSLFENVLNNLFDQSPLICSAEDGLAAVQAVELASVGQFQ